MKQLGYTGTLFLIWLVVLAIGGYGWVMNVIEITRSDFGNITGMLVMRIIGVFMAPLGAVLGYL